MKGSFTPKAVKFWRSIEEEKESTALKYGLVQPLQRNIFNERLFMQKSGYT